MKRFENLMDENITIEQLKKKPEYSRCPEDILNLILVSGKMAKEYKSEQDIPHSPNALSCYKWYKKEVESFTKKIEEAEQKCGIKCSCTKGCAFCCRQLIVVTNVEMLALQLKIDNMNSIERNKLKEVVNEQCQFLVDHGITNERINKSNRLNCIKGNEAKIQTEYFDLNIRCPLLDEDDSCVFYEVRPTICWSYKNYGNNLECEHDVFVDTSIKFDEWDRLSFSRMEKTKRLKPKLWILQFALKEYFDNRMK